jgi:hypothetical protein
VGKKSVMDLWEWYLKRWHVSHATPTGTSNRSTLIDWCFTFYTIYRVIQPQQTPVSLAGSEDECRSSWRLDVTCHSLMRRMPKTEKGNNHGHTPNFPSNNLPI